MQRWGRLLQGSVLSLLGAVLLVGCGQSKRQLLEFFFTGVPAEQQPADLPAGGQPALTVSRQGVPVASAHSYFIHHQCFRCHGTSMAIIGRDLKRQTLRVSGQRTGNDSPGYPLSARPLCLKCHPDPFAVEKGGGPDKHPPVTCTICHRHHQSEFVHLLNAAPKSVCAMCHADEPMDPRDFHHKPIRRKGAR